MLKEVVKYEGFDGEPATEVLRFNLTKTELTENAHLASRFEKLQNDLFGDGTERKLKVEEVQEILDFVKLIMKLSYGILSDDGKRFIKGETIWEEFTQTAVYDEFLFSLFENPERSVMFLANVLPKELREEAVELAKQQGVPLEAPQTIRPVQDVDLPAPQEKKPQDMTRDELIAAMQRRTAEKAQDES